MTEENLPLDFSAGDAQREEELPLSVSELVGLLSDTLQSEFSHLLVAGELKEFNRATSGHCYFTLTDGDAAVDAVMWRSAVVRLGFDPQVGDEVVCRGRVDVYAKQGRLQLYVSAMRPIGAGAAQRAFEELKRKLQAEGLFDEARKRPLPFFPRTIGVVTSRSGAAIHDILTTIRRRCRHCRIVLSPAAVQGANAPAEIVGALDALARFGECDVVIVGRGGGAAEDLAAFNDEAVVRKVAAFPVPVVSAVGHEVDFTLCDFAADLRAATPTAAAETAVPVHDELVAEVTALAERLEGAALRHLDRQRHRIAALAGKLRDPSIAVATGRQRADELLIRMERALVGRHRRAKLALERAHTSLVRIGRSRVHALARRVADFDSRAQRAAREHVTSAREAFASLRSKLDALSPLAVLERGYSLVAAEDGTLVRSAREIATGDMLALRFHEGRAEVRVTRKEDGSEH